jgi:hypothetical protein
MPSRILRELIRPLFPPMHKADDHTDARNDSGVVPVAQSRSGWLGLIIVDVAPYHVNHHAMALDV